MSKDSVKRWTPIQEGRFILRNAESNKEEPGDFVKRVYPKMGKQDQAYVDYCIQEARKERDAAQKGAASE